MSIKPFRVTGIVPVQLQVKTEHIYYRSATLSGGAVDDTILVTSQGGGEELLLQPGQGAPVDPNLSDWVITNASGVGTIDGKLVFNKGGFVDNRPSGQTAIVGTVNVSGTVDVVDGGKSRTLANRAFLAPSDVPVTGVGLAAIAQLWNPPASGKNIILESLTASSTTQQGIGLRAHNVALTTMYANGHSKKFGGADSVVESRYQALANAPGTPLGQLQAQANLPVTYRFIEPVVIPPGWGFIAHAAQNQTDLRCIWEYFEE